ncbi:MAG TPA: TonB family protein, partial [Steroidobacteraceae bacterium]
ITTAAVLSALTAAAPVRADLTPASAHIELPAYRGTLRDDYYPADARSHYIQGRSLVEFSLNDRGVPTDVTVIKSEPAREFDNTSERLVKNLRFEVPANWDAGGAQSHRFRIGVRYQVLACVNFSKCEIASRAPPEDFDTADRTYVVSAQQRVLSMSAGAARGSAPPPAYTGSPDAPRGAPASLPPAPSGPAAPSAPASPGGEEIYPPG